MDKKKSGSVLILALVLASILLSVGMGISGIAMKEIKLSTIGNESGKAFYMADAGAECALFWDLQRPFAESSGYGMKSGTFATSSDSVDYNLTPTAGIRCNSNFDVASNGDPDPLEKGGDWDVLVSSSSGYSYATTTFLYPEDYWNTETPCAIVAVVKKTEEATNVTVTTIYSYGRSSCDSNPRRVERGVKVTY